MPRSPRLAPKATVMQVKLGFTRTPSHKRSLSLSYSLLNLKVCHFTSLPRLTDLRSSVNQKLILVFTETNLKQGTHWTLASHAGVCGEGWKTSSPKNACVPRLTQPQSRPQSLRYFCPKGSRPLGTSLTQSTAIPTAWPIPHACAQLYQPSSGCFALRLQNSPYFCVFKYARAVKQKVWNEAENRET